MSWQAGSGPTTSIPYASSSLEDELLFQEFHQQLHSQQQHHQQQQQHHQQQHQHHQQQQQNHQLEPTNFRAMYSQQPEKILHPPTPDCPPLDPSHIEQISNDYLNDVRIPTVYSTTFYPPSSGASSASNDSAMTNLTPELMLNYSKKSLQTPQQTTPDLMQLRQVQDSRFDNQQQLPGGPTTASNNPQTPQHYQQYNLASSQRRTPGYAQYQTGYDDFDFLSSNYDWGSVPLQQDPSYGAVSTNSLPQYPGPEQQPQQLPQQQFQQQPQQQQQRPQLQHSQPEQVRPKPHTLRHAKSASSLPQKKHYSRPNYGLGVSMPHEKSNSKHKQRAHHEEVKPVPARTLPKKPSYVFSNSSVDDMSKSRIVKKKSSKNLKKAQKGRTENVNKSLQTPAKSQNTDIDHDKSSPTTIPLESTVKKPRQIQQQHEFHYRTLSHTDPTSPTPISKTVGGGPSPTKGIFRSMTASRNNSRVEDSRPTMQSTAPLNITYKPTKQMSVEEATAPQQRPQSQPQPQPQGQAQRQPQPQAKSETKNDFKSKMSRFTAKIGSTLSPTKSSSNSQKQAATHAPPPPAPAFTMHNSTNKENNGPLVTNSTETLAPPPPPPLQPGQRTLHAAKSAPDLGASVNTAAFASPNFLTETPQFDFEALGVPETSWDEFQAQNNDSFNWDPLNAAEDLLRGREWP